MEEKNDLKKQKALERKLKRKTEDLSRLRAIVEFRGGEGKHISIFGGYTFAAGTSSAWKRLVSSSLSSTRGGVVYR